MVFKKGHKSYWKGPKSNQYSAIHFRIKRKIKKPIKCPSCNCLKELELSYKGKESNTEIYSDKLNMWQWLCAKCHHYYDRNRYTGIARIGEKRIVHKWDGTEITKIYLKNPREGGVGKGLTTLTWK